ncbi:hypothetical protein ABOM_009340 [Aspergillus bombycis]|uniref:Non-reducing end beta-L-arabinofuranosidase-like GH127 catalytic domain-containing protein n=1 Tax=Aspergillus bombycis TaxID=109264 RepID=A0A1F7ZSF2_9EURO|nr:hypothetical protein ABOM_009340 [Aspergillus bombycis]OGM42199.1 hypothetical protein ABOM_009340 [Aspergillus bombycis]
MAPAKLVSFKYEEVPVGAIKPRGWVRDQLRLAADGLAGHMFDFYRYVKNSSWLGGTEEYSELNEAAPYWYNGIVPLAYTLDDERLKAQANQFLDYVITHQAEDGWLGPETTKETRGLWARCLLLLGMAAHAQADPGRRDEIIESMLKFTRLAHSMILNNYQGYLSHEGDRFDPLNFGLARAHELSTTLQWLYENAADENRSVIWDTMDLMWTGAEIGGRDWSKFFVPGAFPTSASIKPQPNFQHGINVAQGLRYMAQKYRMNHDEKLARQTREAVDMAFHHHGTPSGSITSDEFLGGLSPERGTELCMAVELMFSLSWLHRLFGDNDYADLTEQAAFNALPGGISPDWWTHQYVTQSNQPWIKRLDGRPFYDVSPYGNIFGLEPDYPCCLVNHHQGLPKLVCSAFVRKGSNGLIHRFLIPAETSMQLDGGHVSVTVDTHYPFDQIIRYRFTTTKSFDFYTRLPGWATASSHANLPDGREIPLGRDHGDVVHFTIPAGSSQLIVTLGTEVRVVHRPLSSAVSIYWGSLLYALDIAYTETSTAATHWKKNVDPLPTDPTYPQLRDRRLVPEEGAEWRVAIDPSQMAIHWASHDTDPASPLPSPIYERGAPPMVILVAAIRIVWPVVNGAAHGVPTEITTESEPFVARFVPFASAPLHMAEVPTVSLPKLDLPGYSP